MKLKIINREEIDAWLYYHGQVLGNPLSGVTGPPPAGVTNEDGDPITRAVNIAWEDDLTRDRCEIRYQTEEEH